MQGHLQRVNPAWTDRLGWTLEELTTTPLIEFIHPDERENTLAAFSALAGGETVKLFENRYLHRDGSYRSLRWNATPVPSRGHVYATARDVTRQKTLEREILRIADCEKERLGRELHDGLCQTLAGIQALSSTQTMRLASAGHFEASENASDISKLLGESIRQARDLAHGLIPAAQESGGITNALDHLAKSTQSLFRIECLLECESPPPPLPLSVQTHLYRIAQEAINNAISHGRAKKVVISLGWENGHGVLAVLDDGTGIPEPICDLKGIGLHTMDYRARLVGGALQVRRRSEGGTELMCKFPLAQSSDSDGDRNDASA